MGNSTTIDYSPLLTNSPLITDAITKIGWIMKKGATRKSWNKRYALLLKSNILVYFADSHCTEHRGTADFSPLTNVHIGSLTQNPSKFKVITDHKTWEFQALDREDAIDWVHHIRQNQNRNSKKKDSPPDHTYTFEYEMKKIKHGLMGWLTKRGELRHTWNRRWCILVPSRVLIYFSDETCQHFKGCADFTGNDCMLLFDDSRPKYFCVQTSTRVWEFLCKTSHQVKHWSLSLQVLHDTDRKALIMKPATKEDANSSKYPSKELLMNHFKSNGSVRDIMWMAPQRVFVIVFDDETAIDYYRTQKRVHVISHAANHSADGSKESPSNASYDSYITNSCSESSETSIRSKGHLIEKTEYKLVAFTFSEYMGEVYSGLAADQLDIMVKKAYKSKALSRRFSAKMVRKSTGKKKGREKANSLVSFTDKYNGSAMAELKRMHSMTHEKTKDTTTDDTKQDFDTSSEDEQEEYVTSCDTEEDADGIPRNIRMTSVTDRGKQIYSHPNNVKTYRNSSIFTFGPQEKPSGSISPSDFAAEPITSPSYIPLLQQSHTNHAEELDDDEDDGGVFEEMECAIIIDNGSGSIKAGFEISIEPCLIPNRCIQSQHDGYIAYSNENIAKLDTEDVICPMKRDTICDWDAMSAIWQYAVKDKVGADAMAEYPLMITEAPGRERPLREKQLEYFMETYDLRKFYLMNSALANFYNTGKSAQDHCVIVDVGHSTSNISCIYDGMYLREYGATIARGGLDITTYLSRAMSNASVYVDLNIAYDTVDEIKKRFCHLVAATTEDYEAAQNDLVRKTYVLPDGRSIEIGQKERYEAPEVLFHGSAIRSNDKSLHSVLMRCIHQMKDDKVERSMYANIYCCGGSAKLPNFAWKLESELTKSLGNASPQNMEKAITVQTMHDPQLSAWYGCTVILAMSGFEDKWITAKEYDEYGANLLFHKCTHQYL